MLNNTIALIVRIFLLYQLNTVYKKKFNLKFHAKINNCFKKKYIFVASQQFVICELLSKYIVSY